MSGQRIRFAPRAHQLGGVIHVTVLQPISRSKLTATCSECGCSRTGRARSTRPRPRSMYSLSRVLVHGSLRGISGECRPAEKAQSIAGRRSAESATDSLARFRDGFAVHAADTSVRYAGCDGIGFKSRGRDKARRFRSAGGRSGCAARPRADAGRVVRRRSNR